MESHWYEWVASHSQSMSMSSLSDPIACQCGVWKTKFSKMCASWAPGPWQRPPAMNHGKILHSHSVKYCSGWLPNISKVVVRYHFGWSTPRYNMWFYNKQPGFYQVSVGMLGLGRQVSCRVAFKIWAEPDRSIDRSIAQNSKDFLRLYLGFSIHGLPQCWMVYKGNPSEMHDLGVPHFRKPPLGLLLRMYRLRVYGRSTEGYHPKLGSTITRVGGHFLQPSFPVHIWHFEKNNTWMKWNRENWRNIGKQWGPSSP